MGGAGRAAPGRGRRTTINDVARAASVSPATVSRVLTGSKRVTDDVAQRVVAAVEELGYQPNPAAQGLLRGASHTIGVVVPDLSNPYFAEVLKAVTAAASERQYRTLVADTDEDVEQEVLAAQELSRWVDGLVLCAPRLPTARLRRLLATSPPTVLVNRVLRDRSAPSVVVDFAAGMRAVCEHLIALGHREVAYLGGPTDAWSDGQRRRVLHRFADSLVVHEIPCGSSQVSGYHVVDEALALRPTALIAFSDYVALGALARLDELGVAVPDDLSLVGFDDLPFGALVRPRLTTVGAEKAHLGKLALEALLDGGAGVLTVPATLVVRESTGRPARRRARARRS